MQQTNDDPHPTTGTQNSSAKQTNPTDSRSDPTSGAEKSIPVFLAASSIAANKTGRLSPAQRRRFIADRFLEHMIGGVIVCFFVALVVYNVSLTNGILVFDPRIVSYQWASFALIGGVTLFMWIFNILPAFGAQAKSVTGTLTKRVITPYLEWPQCAITVDDELFFVAPIIYNLLQDEARYRLFYLGRSKRIGGGIVLSAELLEAAPTEGEAEFD